MENVAANALFLNEPCDDDVEMIKKTRWIHEWKKAAKLPNCKKRKWKPKNKNQIQKLKCQSFYFQTFLIKKKKWKIKTGNVFKIVITIIQRPFRVT